MQLGLKGVSNQRRLSIETPSVDTGVNPFFFHSFPCTQSVESGLARLFNSLEVPFGLGEGYPCLEDCSPLWSRL
jgi:hypothetical protein